jgi:DNA polymerase III alpha subunit
MQLPIVVEDHLLWSDGSISVAPEKVIDYVFKLSSQGLDLKRLYVTHLTPDIIAYNEVSDLPLSVKVKSNFNFPPNWNLPVRYVKLDLDDYLFKLVDRVEKDHLYEKRVERLSTEIFLFKEQKLEDVLRVLIYVIDVMVEKKVIWGVGRGSSCSSYLLYLLGLHEVDAVLYEIEITDFLHD